MGLTRIAIAGLGAAARNIHLPALKKIDGIELVGSHDPIVQIPGLPYFASIEALLEGARPDILVVASPPSAHVDTVCAGLEAGCHIFCEKPLAQSLAEVDHIIKTAHEVGRHVVVNSEFPFIPIHAEARKLIGTERFGRLLFIEARQYFGVSDDMDAGWRGVDPQRTFKEFGTHILDLCKFFFAESPHAMRARMPRPKDTDGPDLLNIIQLEFSGDRVANIILNRLANGTHRYLDIQLVGEKATIETSIGGRAALTLGLDGQSRRPFADLDFAFGGRARLLTGNRHYTIARAPIDLFADATARLFRAFLVALRDGSEPPNSLRDARETIAFLYGAYASAADGSTFRNA